jgi:hypothetical protein
VKVLNASTRKIDERSVDRLVEAHVQAAAASEAYVKSLVTVYKRGIGQIRVTGGFSRQYMKMGDSPRIICVRHSLSSNAVKKPLRNAVYSLAAVQAAKDGWAIADVDLKSCYTSVLLGRIGDGRLDSYRAAVDECGIWDLGGHKCMPDCHRVPVMPRPRTDCRQMPALSLSGSCRGPPRPRTDCPHFVGP